MSLLFLNSSHVGSLPSSSQHQVQPRKPSDQLSKVSVHSTGTVQHNAGRKVSGASAASAGSRATGTLRVTNENVAPSSRNDSLPSLKLLEDSENLSRANSYPEAPLSKSATASIKSSSQRSKANSSLIAIDGTLQDISLNIIDSLPKRLEKGGSDYSSVVESQSGSTTQIGGLLHPSRSLTSRTLSASQSSTQGSEGASSRFKRVINSLRPQHAQNQGQLTVRQERWSLDDFDEGKLPIPGPSRSSRLSLHRKASSWSSGGITTPVKANNVGQAGSIAPQHSEKGSKLRFLMRSSKGNKESDPTQRASVDGSADATHLIEKLAHLRAVQRREVLEEFFSSEEGYVNDLKVLAHVYLTILSSAPHFPRVLQNEVERNLNDMLLLHEEILIHMKLCLRGPISKTRGHQRGNSGESGSRFLDLAKKDSRKSRRSLESLWSRQTSVVISTATPKEAADIARVFGGMMPRFYLYEEYGARYESILHLVASTSKAIPSWGAFERGIEALMNSLLPKKQTEEGKKKGLTLEDLLIKPLQRVCRYPLLLAELLKNTPAVDSTDSEKTIEKVLAQFRKATQEINDATNDPQTRARIQRSWQLQHLVHFPRELGTVAVLRTLGHIKLCGLLYVAFQSHVTRAPQGRYMLCALFGAHLLLAIPDAGAKSFHVRAVLDAAHFRVEDADDGQGVQCHNALCWKLVFLMYQHIYELIMCACSAPEEKQWRTELARTSQNFENVQTLIGATFLDLPVKSMGTAAAAFEISSRRASIQSATKSNLSGGRCQIVIKDTVISGEDQDSPRSISSSLKRSRSVQSPNKTPILAPNRTERARLESLMEAVWTKDLLPFLGIAPQRSGNFIRTSKNTVIRKLSKASTNTQSSQQTISQQSLDDPFTESTNETSQQLCQRTKSNCTPKNSGRSRAQSAGITSVLEEGPEPGAAKKITFARTRGCGMSDATVVAGESSKEDGHEGSKKGKKAQAFRKAFAGMAPKRG